MPNIHVQLCTKMLEGNKATLRFNLKDYSTKAEVLSAVDSLKYLGENTNTTGGLKVARLEVFGENYEERPNVERIIVLITDGVPTYDADKLNDEVAAVKRKGIRIVGLGVTNKVRVFCGLLHCKAGKFRSVTIGNFFDAERKTSDFLSLYVINAETVSNVLL